MAGGRARNDRSPRREREGGGEEGPAPAFAPAFLTGDDKEQFLLRHSRAGGNPAKPKSTRPRSDAGPFFRASRAIRLLWATYALTDLSHVTVQLHKPRTLGVAGWEGAWPNSPSHHRRRFPCPRSDFGPTKFRSLPTQQPIRLRRQQGQ
jgi:hypothetical protein